MSDTNRVALGIVKESTFGVTPTTPAFKQLRVTGMPNLAFAPQTVVSEELRADRQVSDLVLVGAEAGGDVGHELSFLALEDIIEGAMFSTFVQRNNRVDGDVTSIATNVITVVSGTAFAVGDLIFLDGFGDANDGVIFAAIATTNATTITAASGLTDNATPPATAQVRNVGVEGATSDIATAITPNRLTSTILDFTTLGLGPGQWIKIGGGTVGQRYDTLALNDWVRILTVSTNSIELDDVPTGWAADAGTGKTIRLFFGDYIRNGVVDQSYSLEQRFLDHAPVSYQWFEGMKVGNLNLALTAQAIVTATTSFQGANVVSDTTEIAGTTRPAAPANSVLNTSSNVGRVGRGGSKIIGPDFVLDASIEINNNLRRQNAVGSIGSIGIGVGEFSVTGNLSTYFENLNALNDVLNNTETSFDIRFRDASNDNKIVLIDLPRVKYSEGAPTVPGKNQDVTIGLTYQAILHPVLQYTMHLQRHWATEISPAT